jgi:hypothetical protein
MTLKESQAKQRQFLHRDLIFANQQQVGADNEDGAAAIFGNAFERELAEVLSLLKAGEHEIHGNPF